MLDYKVYCYVYYNTTAICSVSRPLVSSIMPIFLDTSINLFIYASFDGISTVEGGVVSLWE